MTREEAVIILDGFKNNPLFNDTHVQAFNMAISALSEKKGEWIPVSERLPNYDECIKRHMSLVLADVQPTDNPRITEITVLKEFEGMTNGEVIQALFPKAKVFKEESNIEYPYVDVFLYSENDMNCYKKDWWNAPYQKGGE